MGRFLFFLIAIAGVILAVLIFAPGIIPVSAYKPKLEEAASNAMGRKVTVSDNLSFKILPQTAFHVEDLTIANEEGFAGEYLAKVGEADIGIKLWPFITSRSVEVERFILTEPDINLVRAKSGKVNWNIASSEAPAEGGASGGEFRDIHLGDVRIINGKARFLDRVADKTYEAEDIDVSVVLKSLKEPLEVDGTMVFQKEPSKINLILTNLAEIMNKEPSNLKLDAKIGDTSVGADLTLVTKDALAYSGPVSLDAPDLPALAALTGTVLADAPGFDRLALSGDVEGGDTSLRLDNAKVGFDKIDAEGIMTLDWSGARPKAGGVLSTDELDLRPYMPPPVENAQGFPEWSTAKMDFSSLRNIDADFDISTKAVYLNDLKFGESRLKLNILNGRMTADIPELAMYGGQGSGSLVVNARSATPSFSGNFDLSSVNAQPFSMDLLKNDNLLGLGSFKFDFTANGASQAAIMSSLDGEGGFDIADGALKGVNIAKMVRAVGEFKEGFNPAALQSAVTAARGANESTDFSEFLSSFKVTDGLVNAPTITLNGPYLTMKGNGSVDLPGQTINLRFSPRATTTIDGEGGKSFSVPVLVGGTFSKPTIGIDAEALIRSGFQNQLKDIITGGGKKNSGGQQPESENAEPQEESKPEDPALQILKGILAPPKKEGGENGSGEKASLEESIANDALNAIFNMPKKTQSKDQSGDGASGE